ncbi:hypothetical protein [Streptomyces sp. NPDC088261]|uniref:hypothetical protein n=1 Tax=Streptomyces sp. NPDC088261 TaxID=3365851 RepID=UPI00382057EA
MAKAFAALEKTRYLRRERGQDAETGLWGTQTHVSDLLMDRIPAVDAPRRRSVGDLPRREKNRGKNLLPESAANAEKAPTAPHADEEEDAFSDDRRQVGTDWPRCLDACTALGPAPPLGWHCQHRSWRT